MNTATIYILAKDGFETSFRPCPDGRVNVTRTYQDQWMGTRFPTLAEAREQWRGLVAKGFTRKA